MVNSISFGSAYKFKNPRVTHSAHQKALNYLIDYCENRGMACYDSISDKNGKTQYTTTIVAPDSEDSLIESFCINRGINFVKSRYEDVLSQQAILNRIAEPSRRSGAQIAMLSCEPFEKLLEKQTTGNFEHCKHDYNNFFRGRTDYMLRSGNEITAPSLYIVPLFDNAEEYIDRYGAEGLNKDSIMIDFDQKTDEPDHCMYFAMKDIGMNKIPVCVNEETYRLGDKLGLFVEK